MRASTHTRAELSTRDRASHQAPCRSPHPKASKSPPSPSPKASSCGPAVLEEAHQSLPAALLNHALCPRLPRLSHEQYRPPQCQLQYNHDPYLLLHPHLNRAPYRNPLQPSMGQQTTRDPHQHHELLPLPHHPPPHQPPPRNPLSKPYTTSPASQQASSVCAKTRSSSSPRKKTTVCPSHPPSPPNTPQTNMI